MQLLYFHHSHLLLKENSLIKVMEGARHNLPDTDAQNAAETIKQLASELTEEDLLLVLISGKYITSLVAYSLHNTLINKMWFNSFRRRLCAITCTHPTDRVARETGCYPQTCSSWCHNSGAEHCASSPLLLKGRRTRTLCSSCTGNMLSVLKLLFIVRKRFQHCPLNITFLITSQVVALILSDVIGDPVDLIASGPTVCSEVWPEEVLSVLEQYNMLNSIPASVKEVLGRPSPRRKDEKDKTDKSENVLNVVIGSNGIALKKAGLRARELGFRPVVLSLGVCGDVKAVSRLYGLLARFACSAEEPPPELAAEVLKLGPEVGVESWDLCRTMHVLGEGRTEGWGSTCLLAGGEPTVELTGKGRGGRNQELALRVGLEMRGLELPPNGPVFLSGGTDGQDGPTEAAGALTDGGLYEEAQAQGLDINNFLTDNDSYTFFSRLSVGQRLLVPGLTCTNVMDVHMLFIPPIPINKD